MQSIILSELPCDTDATVDTIDDAHLAQRMLMLGIRSGTSLRVLHGPSARGAVVLVGGSRLALGKEAADLIRVCLS